MNDNRNNEVDKILEEINRSLANNSADEEIVTQDVSDVSNDKEPELEMTQTFDLNEVNTQNLPDESIDETIVFDLGDTENPLNKSDDVNGVSIADVKKNNTATKKKHKRKNKLLRNIIWILCIILVSVGLAFGALMAFTDITGILGNSSREYEIVIPKGSSTEDIAEILKEKEIIKYPLLFRLYSKFMNADGKYQYGYYVLTSATGYEGIVDKLQTVGATAEEKTITIPEGKTIRQITDIFAKSGLCSEAEFKAALKEDYSYDFLDDIPVESVYYKLEGYLFAETYNFAYVKGEGQNNARQAINKMLSTTEERVFNDKNEQKAKKLGYSLHEILTMASIVQLEAGGAPEEMSSVAKVFYNRLNWDEPKFLGSTPTSNYYSEIYDTNKYEGLPPGPLNSPSIKAIEASLSPNEKLESTYFVTDKNGKFYYTDSIAEHNAIIAKLKNKGIWEY